MTFFFSLAFAFFYSAENKPPFHVLQGPFIRLFFLHSHREASAFPIELPEESERFRFLRASCFVNLKDTVGLIMKKTSVMYVVIPLDLSSRSFIPIPRFIRSGHPTPFD